MPSFFYSLLVYGTHRQPQNEHNVMCEAFDKTDIKITSYVTSAVKVGRFRCVLKYIYVCTRHPYFHNNIYVLSLCQLFTSKTHYAVSTLSNQTRFSSIKSKYRFISWANTKKHTCYMLQVTFDDTHKVQDGVFGISFTKNFWYQ